MTIEQVTESVLLILYKQINSFFFPIRRRAIYYVLLRKRARLQEERLERRKYLKENSYTYLDCVPLQDSNAVECECVPSNLGCRFYRTVGKVPSALSTNTQHIIDYVTTLDGTKKFSETSWSNLTYKKGRKYTSKKNQWFIKGDYMYLTSEKPLKAKFISIKAVFFDPLKAKEQLQLCSEESSDDSSCNNFLLEEFPLEEGSLLDIAVQLTAEELLNIRKQDA